jgi:glycosyltransferase involved in cell wall biosynthesis
MDGFLAWQMRVALFGQVWGRVSYALLNRAYALGLHNQGHDVRVIPAGSIDATQYHDDEMRHVEELCVNSKPEADETVREWSDARLLVLVPTAVRYLDSHDWPANDWAIHTVWETDRVQQGWVPLLNRFKATITATTWNQHVFERQGVTNVTNRVAPEGIDPSTYYPEHESDDQLTFVTVADFNARKGLRQLLTTFAHVFGGGKDAKLLVKTWSMRGEDIDETAERINQFASDFGADIRPITTPLQPEEMRRFYCRGDAFVLPTRGEGWCRPAMEALACGTLPIVTGWSAHEEWLNEDYARFLDYELTEPRRRVAGYKAPQKWAVTSSKDLAEAMADVANNREGVAETAREGSGWVRENWNNGHAAERLEDALVQVFESGT